MLGGGGGGGRRGGGGGDGEDKLKAVTFYHCSVNIYRQNYIYRGGKSC